MKLYKKKTEIYREDHQLYLVRYSIFKCRYFAIKVHHILLSDYACFHDHPWTFITFLIKGWYIEHTEKGCKLYGPFNLLYRPAKYAHRLQIVKPVWSLVITFRKKRSWGFFTKLGWVHWSRYTPTENCE